MRGNLRKLVAALATPVRYRLPLGDRLVPLNDCLGRRFRLSFSGRINCIACGREIRKSYQQGYCFPCVRRLAACDLCMVKPELCHYDAGTCREPAWGREHCLRDHVVYLANTSGLKVGITRLAQVPTRWLDQGACQALPIFRAATRLLAGRLEVILKQEVSDRTDWRRMLRGEPPPLDLPAAAKRLLAFRAGELAALAGAGLAPLSGEVPVTIVYPVRRYPEKVRSYNLDRERQIDDQLLGIKGQYLIFAGGVLPVRKYAGYFVEVAIN
ncbi:MAG: DUF2797 domain-containing protein [Deltaproteobacteria bacterium]|nr:DUF2797 domain-containing protein [Deltaproteobacteria bacterium]